MTGRREWFTAAELAALALPDVPTVKANVLALADRQMWRRPEWEGKRWRRRAGRGGGHEFHVSVLPRLAQVKLALSAGPAEAAAGEVGTSGLQRGELWRWFEGLPEAKRAEARRRLDALDAVERLARSGVARTSAAEHVAREAGIAVSGLYRWADLVRGVARPDWLPRLAPRHAGRPGTVECTAEAWEMVKADYLRLEQPNFSDCYRRLEMTAPAQGWSIPSRSTLQRRIDALPPAEVTLARQGVEALKRLYPAQERDRSGFHALEAVNLDGHRWDVFVRWPDGSVGRPHTLAIQDLYSNRILAWRTDDTLHKGLVQLAFGDVIEQWGIPDRCWFDNGRENAAKAISGGVPNRYRFKVRNEELPGLLPSLGVEVHWTTPYSGQSKPIERGFRDFAQSIAKHPALAGAWTGNTPMAKPENYGSKAVPLDTFLQTVAAGIAEHNSRIGRKSRVCGGKLSFAQAFDASYSAAPIRRATAEQRRLWLLTAEALHVNGRDGTVEIEGNRYWSDLLLPFRGQKVVARFDPAALHEALHVYRMDGGYLGAAECQSAAGFADMEAARTHGRARRAWMRASREMLAAERTMTLDQVAALLPDAPAPAAPPEPRVVRPIFGTAGGAALQRREAEPVEDGIAEGERLLLRATEMRRAERGLRLVPDTEIGRAEGLAVGRAEGLAEG